MKKTHNTQWAHTAMTGEELEQALHRELSSNKPNWDSVQLYLHELHLRVRQQRELTPEEQDAYREFLQAQQQVAEPEKRPLRRPLRPLLAAAVAVCLLITIATVSLGTGGVYGSWSADYFHLIGHPDATVPVPADYVFRTERPELQKIYALVVQEFGEQRIVPTWIPEGYTQEELIVLDLSHTVYSSLTSGDQRISIDFTEYREKNPRNYCKDNVTPDVYEIAGVKHYIFSNAGNWVATWEVNGIECGLFISLSKEVLIQIIDSIYKGG